MPELTDDQLDGLFRKSAEEFDPPFDPAAWQDMKARLDTNEQTMPAGALFWKNMLRWGLPVLLLLLLTGGGWLVYQKTTAKGTTAIDPSRSVETQPDRPTVRSGTPEPGLAGTRSSEQKDDVQKSTDRNESIQAVTNSENRLDKLTERAVPASEPATAPTRTPATKLATTTYGPVADGRLSSPNSIDRATGVASLPIPGRGEAMTGRSEPMTRKKMRVRTDKARNDVSGTEPVALAGAVYSAEPSSSFLNTKRQDMRRRAGIQPDGYAVGGGLTPAEEQETGPSEAFTVYKLAVRPPIWPVVTFTTPSVVAHPDTTAHRSVSKPQIPFQRGLSVRFGVSPDLSSVGLDNFSRPGTNVGAFLEYRLASRWSVQTGLIQSTKIYQAYPDEYVAPTGAWGGYVKPNDIDGRCNMFDIPINVRYDFSVKPKKADTRLANRWFVSTGVTSYIIKTEAYHYNYPPHTYQRTDSTASTGGYGFSNLNVSVGYERALSRRLSWQIEPFIKMPLRGVGLFNVNLLSTGAFFSLRLKL